MVYFNIHERASKNKFTFYIIVQEFGDQFSLTLDDGNGYSITESDLTFTVQNPYNLCLQQVSSVPDTDPNICERMLPRSQFNYYESS